MKIIMLYAAMLVAIAANGTVTHAQQRTVIRSIVSAQARTQDPGGRLLAIKTDRRVVLAPLPPSRAETVRTLNEPGSTVTYFGSIFFYNVGNETFASGDVIVLPSGHAIGRSPTLPEVDPGFDFEAELRNRESTGSSVNGREKPALLDLDALERAAAFMRMTVSVGNGAVEALENLGYVINEKALIIESVEGTGADIDLKGESLERKTEKAFITWQQDVVTITLVSGTHVRELTLQPGRLPESRLRDRD